MKKHHHLGLALTFVLCGTAAAGTDTWFEPLTESAPVVAPNAFEELSAPWVTPAGISQRNFTSLREIEDAILSPGQSVVRVPRGTASSMFDMLAFDPSGSFIFIPHETPLGAGCSRYDIFNNINEVIFQGDGSGTWAGNFDFGAFDPARWTPNGTLWLGEEWTGEGRIVEILNPLDPAGSVTWRELESIANVAHEGINFSRKYDDTIYYVDEWRSGSIYKLVLKDPSDYALGGQTFVLSVDAFAGNPADYFSDPSNVGQPRTGPATWVPLTNEHGNPLPGITDPFRNGPTNDPRTNADTRGGRPAADDAGGTPFGRPEDMSIGELANGNEVLYICTTSETSVISVEILTGPGKGKKSGRGNGQSPNGKAIVRTFASSATPKNAGFKPTTGVLNSPDNLAIDALGNIYIVEDAPNSSSTGGDIWFARDIDNDGVAESIDHFLSIRADGCEATGMIFNPAHPTEFVVAVQHPDSTNLANVPNGLGDAVWAFELTLIPNQDFVDKLLDAGGARGAFLP